LIFGKVRAMELNLDVETRKTTGKNAMRRLRAAGKLPAVVCGGGLESQAIQLDRKQIVDLLAEGNENSVFLLKVPGTKEKRHTMIRELQVDTLRDRILHIDFQRIEMSEKVRVHVMVLLEGTPEGVKNEGAMIDFVTRELEIESLPGDIPAELRLDVSELHLGQHLEAGDVELPSGVDLLEAPERVILSVTMPRAVEEEEEEEGEDLLESELDEPEVISGTKDGDGEKGEEEGEKS